MAAKRLFFGPAKRTCMLKSSACDIVITYTPDLPWHFPLETMVMPPSLHEVMSK